MVTMKDNLILERYLEEKCSPSERSRAEALLRRRPDYRRDLEVLRQINEVVSGLMTVPVSPDYDREFEERFQREVLDRPRPAREKPSHPAWLGYLMPVTLTRAAAAATVLLLVGIGSYFAFFRPGTYPGLLTVRGTAEVYRAEEARWVRAEPGMTIRAGDILSTGAGGQIDLALEKIYALRLKGDAQVVVHRLASSRRSAPTTYAVRSGRIYAVTYDNFKGRVITLETDQAAAVVRGTAFFIEADPEGKTLLNVENGEVSLKSLFEPDDPKATIEVKSGYGTVVIPGGFPAAPRALTAAEKKELTTEISEIGRAVWETSREPRERFKNDLLALLLSDTPDRVVELLKPCGLYVSKHAPLEVYNLLKEAGEAARLGDFEKSVELLGDVLVKYPDPRTDPVLKLLLGAQYYALLSEPAKAIEIFKEVVRGDDPEWSSLARAAIGEIHGELSRQSYREVLKSYRDSLEAEKARQVLKTPSVKDPKE
ncbi:MAG: FecR family protein [PVC group bacterium]